MTEGELAGNQIPPNAIERRWIASPKLPNQTGGSEHRKNHDGRREAFSRRPCAFNSFNHGRYSNARGKPPVRLEGQAGSRPLHFPHRRPDRGETGPRKSQWEGRSKARSGEPDRGSTEQFACAPPRRLRGLPDHCCCRSPEPGRRLRLPRVRSLRRIFLSLERFLDDMPEEWRISFALPEQRTRQHPLQLIHDQHAFLRAQGRSSGHGIFGRRHRSAFFFRGNLPHSVVSSIQARQSRELKPDCGCRYDVSYGRLSKRKLLISKV